MKSNIKEFVKGFVYIGVYVILALFIINTLAKALW